MTEELTVGDVIDTMDDDQLEVMYGLVGEALEEGEENMKHNAFDNDFDDEQELVHSEIMEAVEDGKRTGSMKESFLQHGIENIDYLFPDNKNLTNTPGFIDIHPKAWVAKVMNGVHHTPFSRVKMQFADITGAEARAKGYVKGNVKIEEVISLLKRTINPTTVYKKQKLDRDDVVDITDFDVVAWIKKEMRTKLDEELAGAYLFGDGRLSSDDDKISEAAIIPVVKDTTSDLYAMTVTVTPASGESQGHALINASVKGMDKYEGSGRVIGFFRQDKISDMLLLEDNMGRRLYNNKSDLANAMRLSEIVEVPASVIHDNSVLGVALDLSDYNVGADKGGAVNMFDDFDIDYNAQKYLIETRCSGGLTLPHSALVFKVGE